MRTIEETRLRFPCFGGRVTVLASGGDVERVRTRLQQWHDRLTRFDPASELCLLNAHPAETVRVSPIMACFVAAAIDAAHRTDGLVDPTLAGEIERARYDADLREPIELEHPVRISPARPHPDRRWLGVKIDTAARTVTRPPGTRLDSGGIAKGLFADLAAKLLDGAAAFAIDCCGDIAIGGRGGLARTVLVDDPFRRGEPLHEFAVLAGGVATSGIGRRTWIGPEGRPMHHLLDPSTGLPAYTGLVQVTALGPTAADAEVRAKAAFLSGADRAAQWLPHGGVLVFDDGSHIVL